MPRPARAPAHAAGRVAVVLVVVIGAVWVWFRSEAKSWAWWDPPALLHHAGRDYQRGTDAPVASSVAEEGGSGTWTRVRSEWPMRWGMWASTIPHDVPTVLYLCTSGRDCYDYELEGGP